MSKGKTIFLLYSRQHFDPNKSAKFEDSSAGVIARDVYRTLQTIEDCTTTYLDAFDVSEWKSFRGFEPDFLFGINANLNIARRYFKAKKTIPILVNCHPLERLSIVVRGVSLGFNQHSFTASDGIYDYISDLSHVNSAILFGNEKTRDSYRKWQPELQIFQSTYSPPQIINKAYLPIKEKREIMTCLIFASDLTFRKGIDLIIKLILESDEKCRRFIIVGNVSNEYWAKQFAAMQLRKQNVEYRGMLFKNSNEFAEIIKTADYAIFPSREEGLLGTLLETMMMGIPCLFSEHCGVTAMVPQQNLYLDDSISIEKQVKCFEQYIMKHQNLKTLIKLQEQILQANSQGALSQEILINAMSNKGARLTKKRYWRNWLLFFQEMVGLQRKNRIFLLLIYRNIWQIKNQLRVRRYLLFRRKI